MAHLKVEYPEAIRVLAERAGIEIKYTDGGPQGPGRDDLYRANEWAAGAFRHLLQKAPEAEAARQFLARRGVNDETSEAWSLGYAMDSWDHLLQRARKNGISDAVLEAAGLARKREGRDSCYDFFRHRVIFPIRDAIGKPIGFGGRVLGDEKTQKFINTPETKLFSKRRAFYGLGLAKEEWEKTRTAYIVEGYLDVIVPWQAGVRGIVATLGTALTPDHVKLLRRYVDKVVLVFDPDPSGQKANERGLDLLLPMDVDIFVAELPDGMDPDDVVVKQGPDALRACLEKPREIFDFLMLTLTKRHGGDTPAARQRIVEETLERIAKIEDPVKQELLVQQLAQRFGLQERTLRAAIEKAGKGEAAPAPAPAAARPAVEEAGRELLAWVMADPEAARRIRNELPAERYPTDAQRKIAAAAYPLLDGTGQVKPGELVALLREPALMEEAATIGMIELDRAMAAARVAACLERLSLERERAESRDRQAKIKAAGPDEQSELLRQVMEARKRRPHDRGQLPGRN